MWEVSPADPEQEALDSAIYPCRNGALPGYIEPAVMSKVIRASTTDPQQEVLRMSHHAIHVQRNSKECSNESLTHCLRASNPQVASAAMSALMSKMGSYPLTHSRKPSG